MMSDQLRVTLLLKETTNVQYCQLFFLLFKGILKLLQTKDNTGSARAGIMIPIPQYPLYSATLSEFNSYQVS